jgi:threonine/homoserine/homoserine lactone efflux protein
VTVISALASFALIAGLLTIIPGLDTALVIRSAVSQGRRAGFATALGIGTGTLAWGAAAAVGVSALLTASRLGYDALRIAGAVYLVALGATMLWRSRGPRAGAAAAPAAASADGAVAADTAAGQQANVVTSGHADSAPRPGSLRLWSRGVLTNLLNPKVGVFYVAMLPQFIPARSPHLLMGLALAGVHDVEGMIWFTLLITAAHRARRWLSGGRVKRGLDRITGAVLIGFGVRLAFSR